MSGFNINAVKDSDVETTIKAPLQQNLSASLYTAADANPEEEAALLRLSKTTGMPVEALRLNTNKEEARRVETANKYEAVVNNSPKLAAWLTDHAKASLAHDDTDNMGQIERSWGEVLTDPLASLGQGANQVGGMLDFVNYSLNKVFIHPFVQGTKFDQIINYGHRQNQEYFAGANQSIEEFKSDKLQAQNKNVSRADGVVGSVGALYKNPLALADLITKQIPQLGVSGKVMGLTTKGLSGAQLLAKAGATNIAMNGAMGAADAGTQAEQHVRSMSYEKLAEVSPQYNALIAARHTPEDAREMLAVQAGQVSATIALPLSLGIGKIGSKIEAKFFARLIGENVGKMTIKQALKAAPGTAAKEILEEGADEALSSQMSSNLGVKATTDSTQSVTQGMGKSAVMGGALGMMGGSIPAMTDVGAAVIDRHTARLGQVEQAKKSAQVLTAIDQLHATSKVKTRDADTFGEFIEQATADGKQNIYIDANVLMQSGKAQQLAELSPAVASQLETALATGGEIQIPIAEYAKNIAGHPLNAEIIPDLRVEGQEFTLNQANDYETNALDILSKELTDGVEGKQGDAEFKASRDAVKQLIKNQLSGAAAFDNKANEVNAIIAANRQAVRAAQLGMTPEEFHAKNPLFVKSQIVGENVFSQALKPIDDGAIIEATTPKASDDEIQYAQDMFLSAFSADTGKFGRQEPLLARIRESSDAATNELRGSPETRRSHAERLGAFSGYDIVADTLEGDSLNPSGSLLIRVYGKEQAAKGLTDEPALTITVRQDGELIINGPQPDSKTFDEFKKLGWADYAKGKDGVVADGWSALKDPTRPDKPLPLRQLIPLMADVHARVREWRMEDYTGLHWSRSTGATGGLMNEIDRSSSGRETAVFFQNGQSKQLKPGQTHVDVDGVKRSALNSNGKPIAQTEEGIRNFWKWFGDSRVVDAEGKPLVVYHGTTADFSEFKPDDSVLKLFKDAKQNNDRFGYLNFRYGNYFSPYKDVGNGYTAEGKGLVYPTYLKAENPVSYHGKNDVKGYDASKTPDALFVYSNGVLAEIAVIDPTQIKSAVGNSGEFDPSNPNILFQSQANDLIITHNLTAENLLHATKIGGLPVPSLAVTTKNNPVHGFGEITLIGSKEMADPKGYAKTKTFGADIYSPRYPSVEYHIPAKELKAASRKMWDSEKATGSDIDWGEVKREGARALEKEPAFIVEYLKSKGETPNIVLEKGADQARVEELKAQGFGDYIGKTDVFDLATDKAFEEKAVAVEVARLKARGTAIAEKRAESLVNDDDARYQAAKDKAREIAHQANMERNKGKVDYFATRQAIRDQASDLDDLHKYAKDFLSSLNPEEKIFKGFSSSGNRTYTPHTLDNVVKILKSNLRGGESNHYGVGSIRAKFTPEFKSITEIRANKGRLVDKATFEKVKGEIDNNFEELRASLGPNTSSETLTGILEDAPKMGLEKAAKDYGIELSDESKQKAVEFLDRLKNLPTEYFEAKILRAVDLSEFSGAVVPEGTDQKVIDALKKSGVTDVKTYKAGDEASRTAAINEFANLFFQNQPSPRGSFNPASSTIALLKNANLSTFLHELGHFFFENDIKLASQLIGKENLTEGEQQIIDDVSALLSHSGIKGSPAEQLDQWFGMSFEEQRSHHERTAEMFEKYLFEGKAPSIELQRAFQTMRAWMTNVYKSIKAFLDANPEAGKLSDEVRGVFDRMLATPEQIQLAESARSMMPLFASQEQAKSLGVTIDNFAKYRALGMQGTQDAIESLQARSLRDLQWIGNAKNREVKKLKAESKEARAAVEMEVRREVMSQPVYQAWQFLTAKLTADDKISPAKKKSDPNTVDPSQDNLLTAIAKLGGIAKADAVQVWGVDPKDKPSSGVFGKPVLRANNGLPLDMMAERLAELGYLQQDDNGKADIAEFESLFNDSLRGTEVYSYAKDHSEEPLAGEQLANPGALTAGRIDAVELGAMGLPSEVVNRLHELKMAGANGLHPDLISERFGFSSGDELLREIAVTQEPKAKIQELTDQRMMEQYGDLATPEAIAKAADKAIFNEARAKFISAEDNALSKALGHKGLLKEAAKEFAASMIDGQKLRDIKPNRYAQAEARAAKAAIAARKKGDLATTASEKRNQLVNLYATKLAREALDEAKAADAWFKKVLGGKDDQVAKTRDLDVVNAARAVLGNFGYEGKAKTATEYLKRVAENDPEMFEVLKQSIDATEAQAKPLTDMTIAELRALRIEVEALWHLAKRSRQLEIDGDLLDRQEAADALVERMTEIGIPEFAQGEFSAITAKERATNAIASMLALGRRVESWVDLKDGYNKMGAFRRFVWNPIKIAADRYRTEKAVRLREFRDAFDQVSTTMKKEVIFSPELNYAFGKDAGGVAMNEILHAVLHTGNDSNKRKLLLGRNWAIEREDGTLDTSKWDSFIDRMINEGKITKAHYDFAQRVWDLLESMKPAAQKAHRDAFGKYFDEVTANSFTTPFGEYAGGYIPAVTDTRVVKDNALRKLLEDSKGAMAYALPGTAKGFTKTRVEYNGKLMLDLRTLTQHIDKQLIFSHLENPVKDVSRLISNKGVSSALNRQEPTAVDSIVLPWLARAARQQVTSPIAGDGGLSRFLSVLRQRTSMALMIGNVSNTAQQISGFALAGVKVPKGKMLSAAAQFISNPKEMREAVVELSPYMAERMHSEVTAMMDDIDGILLDPNIYQKAQAWTKAHTFFLQSAVDNVMGPIIWTAAYNNAIEENYTADDAALIADAVIRQTQGSTNPEDVSRLESGPAYARIFTLFAGYFNMQANLLGTEFGKVAQELGVRKGMGRGFYIAVMGFYVPALVAEMIAQAFRGGPPDEDKDGEYLDDWLMSTLVFGQLRNATAMVPFAGQFINSSVSRFNGNPTDDKVSMSPVVGMVEGAAGVPYDLYKSASGEGNAQRTIRDVATLISLTTGLPANLLARPIGYAAGVASDKVDPTGPVDMTRGLITGTASPESKQ